MSLLPEEISTYMLIRVTSKELLPRIACITGSGIIPLQRVMPKEIECVIPRLLYLMRIVTGEKRQ